MNTDNDLFEWVGQNVTIDHVAVQTAFGMLIAATTLFKKLGYIVDSNHKAQGEWGKAIFLTKVNSISIQLTDSSNDSPIPASENHLAIMVDYPQGASLSIQEWAHRGGVSATIEEVPGGKFFVSLPEIITIPIELVPNPKACSDCHDKGRVQRTLFEGPYPVLCETCHGNGYDIEI